jgi:hypothetical protein
MNREELDRLPRRARVPRRARLIDNERRDRRTVIAIDLAILSVPPESRRTDVRTARTYIRTSDLARGVDYSVGSASTRMESL